MFEILLPGLILGGFALISSAGLFLASKKFHVDEDPRIEKVVEMLPNANCGACGFAGCQAYAENAVHKMSLETPCPVATEEAMFKISEFLGVDSGSSVKMVSSLMCNGTDANTQRIAEYHGIEDCWAYTLIADANKACAFACLGLGSCVTTCPFDAMKIENGIVVIDEEKCTGCTLCIDACPKHILHMRPVDKRVTVTCFNTDNGAMAKKACNVACIGCMKCEKVCEDDAIHVNNFLAKIDYDKCTQCEKCVDVCPTDAIQVMGGRVHVATENV